MAGRPGLQLWSTVTREGVLRLDLQRVPVPEPRDDEVVVRVEAAPINPSDLGVMLGLADAGTFKQASANEVGPVIEAQVPKKLLRVLAARLDQPLPVGNEGAGVVVQAGKSKAAQALLGKTVGLTVGGLYAEFKTVKASQCQAFPDGVTPAEGASWFVNPMTALGMVETMRAEGHKALVHTAAASNLGQMLQKICLADGIGLVNVVRKPEQAELLRSLGAKHVVDSSSPRFVDDLTAAIAATGATLAFDAVGGGRLATQILGCMEAAASAAAGGGYNGPYGTGVHKQVYIYGGLDPSPTVLTRNAGFQWSVGGWLLTPFLQKAGPEVVLRLRRRVAAEIRTTFASSYTSEVSLAEALELRHLLGYTRQATGEKYLVVPHRSPSSRL